jgi:hypothetical protein
MLRLAYISVWPMDGSFPDVKVFERGAELNQRSGAQLSKPFAPLMSHDLVLHQPLNLEV